MAGINKKYLSYYNKIFKEFELNNWDLKKALGKKKLTTYLGTKKGFEELKENVRDTRAYYKERKKIHKEYEEIQKKQETKSKEFNKTKEYVKESQRKAYVFNKGLRGGNRGTLPPAENENGITFTKVQRVRIKNLFENHRNLYNKLIKELVNKYGINQTDISLLEGEIIQSDRGNTFNLPVDVKGFDSMDSLLNSFTNQANIDNLLNIYEKDLKNMESGELSIKGRIEGQDFKDLFKGLKEDGLLTDVEEELLNKLIDKTRFTTKEAIRNHFGKLTNMIESDPLTGVKVRSYYATLSNWINKFDKANYSVRR